MSATVPGEDSAVPKVSRPTISVPPRGSMETIFTSGSDIGFSPGPMTLVSSFFSDQSPFSFSQLLAGATTPPSTKLNDSVKEIEGVSDDKNIGYKRNKPTNLVVTQPQPQLESLSLSPLFMFPPGLSPSGLLNSPGFLSPLQSPFGMSHQQALAHVTAQAALSQSFIQMQEEFQTSSSTALAQKLALIGPEIPKVESPEVSQSDKRASVIATENPASDGYKWRKYGQKQVKASECPRSYYKCTYLSCPVKKKVERSFDGHISEITYKGKHNHDPPESNKRGKDSSGLDRTGNSQMKPVFASQGPTEPNGFNGSVSRYSEPMNDHLTARNNEEIDYTSIVVNEGDDEEPATKRRIMDIGPSIPASSHQTVTESKIVVQTRSEVDLLDDGYKWRKYGQKVVKGNPHPRSYYRCTFAGCNVRKHVERASADHTAVITTYEGKHGHEIPTGKYSTHHATAAYSTMQHLKRQKMVAKNPLIGNEMNLGNKDQMPMTLRLKEEQIAA